MKTHVTNNTIIYKAISLHNITCYNDIKEWFKSPHSNIMVHVFHVSQTPSISLQVL